MSDSPTLPDGGKQLPATLSIHGDFLEKATPQWLIDASAARKSALKAAAPVMPAWYKNASIAQRKTVDASFLASAVAQFQLDKTMATFKDIDDFAKPLLVNALKEQYQVEVDVDKILLCLRRPLAVGIIELEVSSFQFLKLSMLQAALHNFEADECKEGAYHTTSGFIEATSTPGTYHSVTVNLTVSQFLGLCRSLDIGAKYQVYLQGFFYPEEAPAQVALREQFIASQKSALKAAAEQALLTQDIEPADHRMILSVIDGEIHPWMGDKQVWFRTLSLMKLRMTGCMAFVICKKYTYPDELILYVPHDPEHPLKRYRWSQMAHEFKRLLTARDTSKPFDATPTPYQAFFSRFVPYEKRPYFFSQFTQKAADSPTDIWRSPWKTLLDFTTPHFVTGIKELPPEAPAKLEPKSDPYLAPSTLQRRGHGIWADNIDPWRYFYEQHREQVIAGARAHAVPAADVDTRARDEKLAHLLEVGMLGLNMVSMFVPVLGEVMMGVMAGQLLYETLEGSIEWAEGDKQAAKAHLIDVAENLAQLAVMAGVGAGAKKFSAAKPEPVIERLSPVTLPNGETRLWKPDLSGYERTVSLDAGPGPNALGQHKLNGETYIRQGNKVYEQIFDEKIKKWRIKHPMNTEVYQPILESNGRGAWRHTLERPLEWDRLTLLRRMGHETETFSDTELIKVADVSGVSDNALRKMHMDHAPPPPELTDAMRLFKADGEADQVIEQMRGTQPINGRYLYTLPLVVEMPTWPKTRVLEVFEGPLLSGRSIKYGAGRRPRGVAAKPSIKITRRDILGGELPERILVALDEQEIVTLLGGEGARVPESRLQEFVKQLADYAQTRKPAIFDSLYAGTEAPNARVRKLQRYCPGLSEAAAQDVLAHAGAHDLARMDATGLTDTVPLTLLEEARWYARQGRQTRAYAGLRSDNMASADSRRLALHILEKLPGWPDTLRLEVRDISDSGPLVDSIGSVSARDKKYLVRKGPRFQAFNERGEALNSLPKEGDNFYASLMHALPDEARRGLGVPQVSQSPQLQEKVIAFADSYRSETSQWLAPQERRPTPSVRINDTLLGYYSSGRVSNVNGSLAARARDIYELSDEQASRFINRLRLEGRNDKSIFNLLQNHQNEFAELERTLDQWVGQPAVAPDPLSATPDDSAYRHRAHVAGAFKELWRRAPLAEEDSSAAGFSIELNEPLPPLTVEFAHVHELSVSGPGMADAHADAILTRFPNVQTLSIGNKLQGRLLIPDAPSLTAVPQAVSRMTALKSFTFKSDAPLLEANFSSRINALTSLETLQLECTGFSTGVYGGLDSLDFSAWVQLKRLRIEAPHMLTQWPASVERLPHLERLDLSNTDIRALPDRLYSGHEKLWAGLSMSWSKFNRETFRLAYEYVKNYPQSSGHLVDLHQMVREYARAEIGSMINDARTVVALYEKIITTWDTPETRFAAVEAIRTEYQGVFGQFYRRDIVVGFRPVLRRPGWQRGGSVDVVTALEQNWGQAVAKRYGLDAEESVFELPVPGAYDGVPMPDSNRLELPRFPAGTFSHVTTLRLGWKGASIQRTREFIRAFSGTTTLELKGLGLAEIPIGAGELPVLARLDLSDNHLIVTPAVQAQLSGLRSLEQLDLRNNPLNELDVSALTRLKALNLKSTQLQVWPAGAQGLPQLTWLDLRGNQITELPPEVLANDEVLIKVNLTGNTFSPTGASALESAYQRVESAKGLPEGTLSRFALEPVPQQFPPQETGPLLADNLLPLPPSVVGLDEAADFVGRLQRMNSAITKGQAQQHLQRLRDSKMSPSQIEAQLIEWEKDFRSLTLQLNGWLYTREVQLEGDGLQAQSRGLAAQSIREVWQDSLLGGTGQTLNLLGTKTGDFPALTADFSHVRTLDLTGVGLSAQGSNGFLAAFPQLNRLVLNGNALTTLPEAVERMGHLERLQLMSNHFSTAEPLDSLLGSLGLHWLDLSHNRLSEFSLPHLSRIETLHLSYNQITQWPEGTLEAASLRTLNLSGNRLETIPDAILERNHEGLVAGTDLSENHRLSLSSLLELRHYCDYDDSVQVMGITRRELDSRIRQLYRDDASEWDSDPDSNSSSDDDSDSDGGVDEHARVATPEEVENPQLDVSAEALEPWLANSRADLRALRTDLWTQLAREDNHERFFRLISLLRETKDFQLVRIGLASRVWEVIQAATENTELRHRLFQESETHGTCPDGRILTFSNLEVAAHVYNVLRTIPRQQTVQRGRALVNLARQMFRLDRVETLAEVSAQNLDRAEERLMYRIGMTRGWPDGLILPGQPENMIWGTPISGDLLATARTSILEAEASDAFYQHLLSQDYWVRYLEERYPQAFTELAENAARRLDQVEDEHVHSNDSQETQALYHQALKDLESERVTARANKLKTLSREEVQRLEGAVETPQPGPSTRQ
ncbi:NEL-type E3 ubiquitin ligase domain-containing protein [Pseudomonas fluorescens]